MYKWKRSYEIQITVKEIRILLKKSYQILRLDDHSRKESEKFKPLHS